MSETCETNHYDVIVLGCGSMGSSACYHLASRGFKVLGIEQFDIAHANGSQHGDTRIIRLAYFEGSEYVAFAKRSIYLWQKLEQEIGAPNSLYVKTGSLDFGPIDNPIFTGALQSCIDNGLEHEVLTGSQIRTRFPAFSGVPDEYIGCFQPDGGFLDPEECVRAYVKCARRLGAEIHTNERVHSYDNLSPTVVEVKTSKGRYTANRIIITAGAWTSIISPSLNNYTTLSPERQVVAWFETEPSVATAFEPGNMPVCIGFVNEREYYAFPTYKQPGMKMGLFNHRYEEVDPDTRDRVTVDDEDERLLRPFLHQIFPKANGKMISSCTCLFTNSVDHHFIIDRLPDSPQVLVACGFSGHGFKFASAVGELLADMLQGHNGYSTNLCAQMFSLSRFSQDPSKLVDRIHRFTSAL